MLKPAKLFVRTRSPFLTLRSTLRLLVVGLTGLMLLPLAGCGADEVPSAPVDSRYVMEQAPEDSLPPAIEKIKENGRLLIGTRFDQPLTGLRNEATGRIDGFDAEIGRIIAQRIFGTTKEGVNIEFVETVADNRIDYLNDDKVDLVIATFTINDERKTKVDFAGPYFVAGQSILVKNSNDEITSFDDLAGDQVCTAKGSTSADKIKEVAPAATVVELADYSSCVAALDNGDDSVDAVTTDNVILQGFTQSNPGAYRVIDDTITTENYGIGIKKDSAEVRDFINDTLQMAFDNGDWKRAFDITFGHTSMKMPPYPELNRY